VVRTAKTVGSTVALMVNILSTKNGCIDLFNAMAKTTFLISSYFIQDIKETSIALTALTA